MGLAEVVLCAAFSFSPNAQAASDSTPDRPAVTAVAKAAADSTKPILLTPVVVSAPRNQTGDATWVPSSARSLYADDGSKMLLGDLRVSSVLPASAALSLYGLPVEQTARDYIWGHRIGGPTTAVFGSRTKVNPDVVRIALHPFLMSHRYRDTNGSLEWRPEYQSPHRQSLSVSSDLIERRATLWIARGWSEEAPRFQMVTSVRQSDVVPFLEDAVPELKAIPRYTDSQTYTSLRLGDQTIEGFFLFGRETGDWREVLNGEHAAVLQDTRQNLAIVRAVRRLPLDSRLTAGVSWEGDHVDAQYHFGQFNQGTRSASHILNPRLEYSVANDAVTTWVSQFCVESEPGGSFWRDNLDAGIEGRVTKGWLTVQPSLAFQRVREEATIVHGATARVHPGPVTVSAGYGTYADYFTFRDGIFRSVFDPGERQTPQTAVHYVASVQYEPKRKLPFDLIRLTGVRKDMDVDLGLSRGSVQVLAWDFIAARGGNLSWEIACLANQARRNDVPLVGVIPFSLRVGVSGRVVRSFNVAVEGNFRSGSIAEYRAPGPRYGETFQLDPSHFVNVALTQTFRVYHRPAHLTVMVFNALALAGSRSELTVDEYGRRYDAPFWGNIRLRYDVW